MQRVSITESRGGIDCFDRFVPGLAARAKHQIFSRGKAVREGKMRNTYRFWRLRSSFSTQTRFVVLLTAGGLVFILRVVSDGFVLGDCDANRMGSV